jgi:hypothetical protein
MDYLKAKGYGGLSAVRLDHDRTAGAGLLRPDERHTQRERVLGGSGGWGGSPKRHRWWGGCLGGGGSSTRPPCTGGEAGGGLVCRERVMAGAAICGDGIASKLVLRRGRVGEDVWEGEADGGSSMASSGGLL